MTLHRGDGPSLTSCQGVQVRRPAGISETGIYSTAVCCELKPQYVACGNVAATSAAASTRHTPCSLTARLRHVMLMFASLVLRGGCPNAGIPLAFSIVSCEPNKANYAKKQQLPRCVTLCSFLKRECTGNGPKDQGQSMKSPLSVMNSVAKDASLPIYCSWPSNIVAGQGNGRSALNPTLKVNVWRLGLTRRGDYQELCLWLRRTSPSTLDLYQASHPDKAWIA